LAFLSIGTFDAWRCVTALILAAIMDGKRCRRRGGLFVVIYLASRHLPGLWALSLLAWARQREQLLPPVPLASASQPYLSERRVTAEKPIRPSRVWLLRGNLNYFSERRTSRGRALLRALHSNTTTRSHTCFLPRIHRRISKHTACHTPILSHALRAFAHCIAHDCYSQGKNVIAQFRES
jgi:hypothetical protein